MNIFLIDPDPVISAKNLFACDPIRANKQIVECAQLLAFFEIWHTGSTTLLRMDGQQYKANTSQLNHPLSMHMRYHRSTYDLCWSVVHGLLAQRPDHSCGISLRNYTSKRMLAYGTNIEYVVIRKDHDIRFVKSLAEYANTLHEYLIKYKWDRNSAG
jgi:hypothetical protein